MLTTEIFKVKNSLEPEIMIQFFEIKEPHYNLRLETSHFETENVKSTNYAIQSVPHLGPKIWNIVPQNIRKFNSLNEFKSLIKFGNLILVFVDSAKTALLKWDLFDLIYIETICFSFSNQFFSVGVSQLNII